MSDIDYRRLRQVIAEGVTEGVAIGGGTVGALIAVLGFRAPWYLLLIPFGFVLILTFARTRQEVRRDRAASKTRSDELKRAISAAEAEESLEKTLREGSERSSLSRDHPDLGTRG